MRAPSRSAAISRRSVSGSSSGVSAKTTMTSPPCRSSAGRAASTALPVPVGAACSNTSMSDATRRASSRTASMPGATTSASLASGTADRAVASTCASIERPAMACSTFGLSDRMRTPLPAARTTINRRWSVMSNWSCCSCPIGRDRFLRRPCAEFEPSRTSDRAVSLIHNNLWHFEHSSTIQASGAWALALTAPPPFATVLDDSARVLSSVARKLPRL